MLIGLAVHAAMCGPNLVSALANAVFEVLIHVNALELADDDPSSSPSIVNDGLISGRIHATGCSGLRAYQNQEMCAGSGRKLWLELLSGSFKLIYKEKDEAANWRRPISSWAGFAVAAGPLTPLVVP